eukprot:81618_1
MVIASTSFTLLSGSSSGTSSCHFPSLFASNIWSSMLALIRPRHMGQLNPALACPSMFINHVFYGAIGLRIRRIFGCNCKYCFLVQCNGQYILIAERLLSSSFS